MSQTGTANIEVIQGDITRVSADAIVNAANSELAMGAGVCGAIFRAAGVEKMTRACRDIGHCHIGAAVITPAFGIATAKHVIHAVGPVYGRYGPDEARELLRSAYRSAILLAREHGCRSIAFPAISTGVYGYPLEEACVEAVDVCRAESAATGVAVKLVGFEAATVACLEKQVQHAG
jgi:O-acetyl-ADP-ribose deacetylase